MSLYDLKASNKSLKSVLFSYDNSNVFVVEIISDFSFPVS